MENHWIDYTEMGAGRPVILIHGVAASRHDWDTLAPALVDAGFKVFTPDLPGHGHSAKPHNRRFYQARAMTAVMADWINSLNLEHPALLVGHSLGGYISLQYSLRYPDKTSALVLVNPFTGPGQLPIYFRSLQHQIHWSEKAISLVPERLVAALLRFNPDGASQMTKSERQQIAADLKRSSPYVLHAIATAQNLALDLPQLLSPTLLIWGRKDRTLDPASFPRLVARMPHVENLPIPDCGHQPHVLRPDLVNPAIVRFLQRMVVDARPLAQ